MNGKLDRAIFFLVSVGIVTTIFPAVAQIVPDETLGTERSIVTGEALRDLIEGGAIRGSNLFHSFREFNVSEGQAVYFANPTGIDNILTRVTGDRTSDIFGTLGVDGAANLILINPNGIYFGPNAHLDIAGSLLATTADSVVFDNGFQFSAANPDAPPLLTLNITPGLQYGTPTSGSTIANVGNLSVRRDLTLAADNLDLQGRLEAGQDLRLYAQDTVSLHDSTRVPFVAMAGEQLQVRGDRTVEISASNHPESGLFSGGDLVLRSSVPLGGDARYVAGGDFRIEGLAGGLGDWFGSRNLIVHASEDVRFASYTGSSLHIWAGGSVEIDSVEITGTDPSDVRQETVTLSDGNTVTIDGSRYPTLDIRAGTTAVGSATPTAEIAVNNITIAAPDGWVFLTNQYQPNSAPSGTIRVGNLHTNDEWGNFSGNGGSIAIDSRSNMALNPLGTIDSSSATGNSGNIRTIANDEISLASGALMRSGTLGLGTSGDIDLATRNLSLISGALISTSTLGEGSGGNLTVTASESVQLEGGSNLQAGTRGMGDAGDLTVTTGRLSLREGSQILTSTLGDRSGGNLTIRATEAVELSGTSANEPGGLFAVTFGAGNGGDLSVETGRLTVRDGASVSTNTFAGGAGGDLTIVASEAVEVMGFSADGQWRSGLFANAFGTGNGGHLAIDTRQLRVGEGAPISASTFGSGNAGNLTANAAESVELVGIDGGFATGLFSEAGETATGSVGDLTVNAGTLSIRHGAIVSASSFGEGSPGNLRVNASQSLELVGARIDEDGDYLSSGLFTSTSGSQDAGNLTVSTRRLLLQDGGQASASTLGRGRGGDLTVMASEVVEIAGTAANLEFASFLNTRSVGDESLGIRAQGDGGDLRIETARLLLRDGGQLSVSTSADGDAGNLTIAASESVQLLDTPPANPEGVVSGVFAQVLEGATGNGGTIGIYTPSLVLSEGSVVSSNTLARGNAGNIAISADSIALGDGSRLSVEAATTAQAGNLTLETGRLTAENGSSLTVSSPVGQAGNLHLTADEIVLDRSRITAETGTSPEEGGANIALRVAQLLRLENESMISATAFGNANGGNIAIDTEFLVARPPTGREGSDIRANAVLGDGGRVDLHARGIFGIEFRDRPTLANDITVSSEFGSAGVVEIDTPEIDPSWGLVKLPSDVETPPILQGCEVGRGQAESRFLQTGRGGLPPSPTEPLSSSEVWQDVQLPATLTEDGATPDRLIEATGWTIDADGTVRLVAERPEDLSPPSCRWR